MREVAEGVRGLYTGFEGYAVPTAEDLQQALLTSLIVPDANVLLNLYRYTAEPRDGLLTALQRVGDRLWVPHQALAEFWENRESTLDDPQGTKRAATELNKSQSNAVTSLRVWAKRVSLPSERRLDLERQIERSFEDITTAIHEVSDALSPMSARETSSDPILRALETLLAGHVGAALEKNAHEAALKEGMRRVEENQPPGYKDRAKSGERAVGDYLIWEQMLVEAAERQLDVVFVTSDTKEDWWRIEKDEHRGPRVELVNEMRERTGRHLYMLRPTDFLDLARVSLKVSVSQDSVQFAANVDQLLAASDDAPAFGGWTLRTATELMDRLSEEAPNQANVLMEAIRHEGRVTRDEIYEITGYSPGRSLRGFIKPILRVTRMLRYQGFLPEDAEEVFKADYDVWTASSPGWASGYSVNEDVLPVFVRWLDLKEREEELAEPVTD